MRWTFDLVRGLIEILVSFTLEFERAGGEYLDSQIGKCGETSIRPIRAAGKTLRLKTIAARNGVQPNPIRNLFSPPNDLVVPAGHECLALIAEPRPPMNSGLGRSLPDPDARSGACPQRTGI